MANPGLQTLLTNLANQIAQLVQQLQMAPAPQERNGFFMARPKDMNERHRPITTLAYKKNKKDTNVISDPNIVPEQGSTEGPVDVVMEEAEFPEPPIEEVNDTKNELNRVEPKEVVVEKDEDLEDRIYSVSDFEDLSGPRYYKESKVTADYIELVVSWDEEEKYWNQDVRDFPEEKDLISFIDTSEESKINKGSIQFVKSFRYEGSLAGIPIGQADFPSMRDLLDFYYDDTTVDREYHIGQVPQNIKDQLETMLQTRQDNFVWDSKDLGCTTVVKHKIHMGDAPAVELRSYRHTPKEREFMKEEIIRMLREGIILKDSYLLPRIQDLLKSLKGACYFSTLDLAKIKVLGHIISPQGIKTDPKKVAAIQHFPISRTLRQLRGFLGLASYYRKFIPDFTRIAAPLNRLLKKNVRYQWTNTEQGSFDLLKLKLTQTPVLAYPNFNQPFILFTNASDAALGAILAQKNSNEQDRVISYASRSLSPAEKITLPPKRSV
ncbi:15668_t:CDS:2 [Gigaspora rosea]|nr:15668_t:CDS:2 [Gigaspora rosea]